MFIDKQQYSRWARMNAYDNLPAHKRMFAQYNHEFFSDDEIRVHKIADLQRAKPRRIASVIRQTYGLDHPGATYVRKET